MAEVQSSLITLSNPRSPVSESYRALRTSIQFADLDQEIRTLLITSSASGEGKSTVLANLGVAFAQAEHRVILVDADLRQPSLHQLFGLPNDVGFTSMILPNFAGGPPLQETGVPGLRVLTSGPPPPNPAELLASRRVQAAIDQLAGLADLVLFDSPPIVAVTDAAILARKVDGAVLVVSAGRTRREHAVRARQQLEKVNARVLGVVLNNVRVEASLYSYYGQA